MSETLKTDSSNVLKPEFSNLNMFDLIYHPVLIVDTDLSIVYYNKSFTNTVGHLNQDLIGKNLISYVFPKDSELVKINFDYASEDSKEFEISFRIKTGSRGYIWLAATVGSFKDNGKDLYLINLSSIYPNYYSLDIDDTRKLTPLQQDNYLGSRVITDGEGRIFDVNNGFSRLIKTDRNNIIGTYLYQIVQFSREIFKGIANIYLAYNYSDNGVALQQSYVTKLFGTNINMRQEYYDNFINQSRSLVVDNIQYQSNLGLNRSLSLPKLKNSNLSFDAEYANYESGKGQMQLTGGFSTVVKGFSFDNTVTGRFDNNNNESVNGAFSLRTNYNKGYYKMDARYELHPTETLDSISFSTQRYISDDLSLRFSATQPLGSNNVTTFGSSLNYLHQDYILSFSASIDTNANYSLGVNLSFSLYEDPADNFNISSDISAEKGSVAAYAFIDENFDNKYDPVTEEMLKNIVFKKGSKPLSYLDNGYAYSRDISSYRPVDITIDSSSLDDPLWYPAKEGYSVVLRPGVTQELAFPIHRTAEIDGIIYLEGATRGGEGTISGMTVYLVDENGSKAAEAVSEYDGYFMFEKVIAGRYFIIASDKQLNELGLKQVNKPEVIITSEDDYYPDNHITIYNSEHKSDDQNKSDLKNNPESKKELEGLTLNNQ